MDVQELNVGRLDLGGVTDMGKRDRDESLCFHPCPLGGYKGKDFLVDDRRTANMFTTRGLSC